MTCRQLGYGCSLIVLFLCLYVSYCKGQEEATTLRSVIVLTRHGDRTPVKLFPNTRSKWPEGLGQLTGLGMKQLYNLGQRFRERYIDQYKFLAPTYQTKEVHVRSTSKERTLMSAQSFMLGLFPPGVGPKDALPHDLQVVPIHAAPPAEDFLLYSYKNCPKLSDLTRQVRTSSEWKAAEARTESLRGRLSEIFGFPVRLKDLHSINTIIRCEEIHQKERLSGIDDPELRKELLEVNDWLFRVKFPTVEMGRLAGGNLLHEMATIFDSHTPETLHKKMPKFNLFSAHDGTILALMAAMDAKNFSLPRYADFLSFELHDANEGFFVKVFYNDQPFSIPSCNHKCKLSDFYGLAKQMKHDDWFDACGIDRCTRKESEKTEKALEEEGNIRFKEERQILVEDMKAEKEFNKTLVRFEWELVGLGMALGVGVSWAFSFMLGQFGGSKPTGDKKKGNKKK